MSPGQGGRQSHAASTPIPYQAKGRCLPGCGVGVGVQVTPGTADFIPTVLAVLTGAQHGIPEGLIQMVGVRGPSGILPD